MHPLEQDEQNSIGYYFSSSYLTNTSNIPSNLLTEIDKDIADIIFYSNLGDYIDGYLSNCDAHLQYFSEGSISPANILFIQNESLQQISKYFEITNVVPNSFNECILVQKTDLSGYSMPEYSYSIGDNISILPFAYEESELIVNNTFVIDPLNVSVSNIFNTNDFLLDGVIKDKNPFLFKVLNYYIDFVSEQPLLLLPLGYMTDFFHSFPILLSSEIGIHIQFLYDFSSLKITDLKEVYKSAENLPDLSGFSYYHDLSADVTPELADFMTLFRKNIQQQWFRLFAIGLASIVFSLFILWLSFSSNTLKLSDIYANFMTRGYSRKTILNIFTISRFIEISISCLIALIFTVPLTYLNLEIISSITKASSLTLNLISFSAVFVPSLLFFIFLFTFSVVNLVMLVRKVEKFFPNRLSSFTATTSGSTKTQMIVIGLSGLFSLLSMTSLLIIRNFVENQGVLGSEILFILDIFLFIFISIVIFCLLFILINSLLKQIVKLSHSLWKKGTKKFSIILHNLSLAFQHHKKQSFFITLSFLLFIQSFLVPAYLSQHATNSAKFDLGSDVAIQLENPSNTSYLLSDMSGIPSVQSAANYSLVQLSIFDIDYQVLVISQTFGSTISYSKDYDLGIVKDGLEEFSDTPNSILTQSEDVFLNSRIVYGSESNSIVLGFNNISADDEQFIEQEFKVFDKFHLFPLLLNDYQLSTYHFEKNSIPFLVMTESAFQVILQHNEDISIVSLEEAIIIKLNKQSEMQTFLQALQSTPYSIIHTTWIDVYPDYLPTFATSIIALSITTGVFVGISFFIVGIVLVQDMLNTRRERILVLRYRGFSVKTISSNFLFEYLFVLLLILPISCGAGIGSLVYLLRVLIKAENWILKVPYYSQFSLYLSVILVALIGVDILIRHFYQKKFFEFQPSIMEGT
ncbi:MAG: hypothetical protein HZR80_00425 [Candidatus Heimdallarchaeota archaeon]